MEIALNTKIRSQLFDQIEGITYLFSCPENQKVTELRKSSIEKQCIDAFGAESWKNRPNKNQVHGIRIVEVENPEQQCGDSDGLMSSQSQIPLSIITADCLPILIASLKDKKIAAIHAGWRGVFSNIHLEILKLLSQSAHGSEHFSIVIGPHIQGCCYEISEELADQFSTRFHDLNSQQIFSKPKHLNLSSVFIESLKKAGHHKLQFEVIKHCTYCSERRFFSHRKWTHTQNSMDQGRQVSAIMRT